MIELNRNKLKFARTYFKIIRESKVSLFTLCKYTNNFEKNLARSFN